MNTYIQNSYGRKILAISILAIIFSTGSAQAQLNPLAAIYYQNQYLGNPAMAGFETGLCINASYRKQWSSIPGTPQTQAVTGEYGFQKVGIGLSLITDRTGLQQYTHMVGSYAYHIALNDNDQKLHFGVSMGLSTDRINQQDINGNQNDVLVGQYNERETYLDGDVGVAYSTAKLTLQGSLPNLKSFLKTDDNIGTADQPTVFAAVAYKMQAGTEQDGVSIEPKVCFRGVRGWKDLVDVGSNFTFINGKLMMMGIYHSSKSTSFGAGIRYQAIMISGMYTNEPAALRGNVSGDFELNLKVNLFR